MALPPEKAAKLEAIKPCLVSKSEAELIALIDSGDIVNDPHFGLYKDNKFSSFYAPFDWINDAADIVIIGITPGKSQAKVALTELRQSFVDKDLSQQAAARAKQKASFRGEMREIGAKLMDHFRLHTLFGLPQSDALFGAAANRAHYTSVLRYPVLERKVDKKSGIPTWVNYSGNGDLMNVPFMADMIEDNLVPELRLFPNSWLLPFGPVPASVLNVLARRGIVDDTRILDGINHPSGTQWNRHNCQLNSSDDHSTCGRNVGCDKIRARSANLHRKISEILATRSAPT